jgi:uncharacterized protein (TIGR03067 family)
MKRHIFSILTGFGFAAACITPAFGDDLEALAGKWSIQKTNEDGQRYTQQIEIKKDKFIFQITDRDGDTTLYAEGKVKLEKLGPFKAINFTDIKGGQSSQQLDSIDDAYTCIYLLDGDTWQVVMNFDKERGDMFKPSLDVMHKVPAPKKAADAPKPDASK